jgi:two-component system, OmpR family, sensor histidine kinase ArlS
LEGYEIDKNNSITFDETSIEEFDRLNVTIDKLITRNKLIFNSQKEFIENAAHEMQTPLAVFKSKMELLQQQPKITEDQYHLLEELNETISRLTKLNKNLLLLSRVENQQYNELENVSWQQIVTKLFTFYEEQAEVKNIAIDLQIIENPSSKANAALVEVLLSNLFLNAIKHNHFNGMVAVELHKDKLIFSNSSEEKPLENNTLFERFSKSNPSKAGTGLGLAIVKKICEQNQWQIHYSFENKQHFFTLYF